MWRRDPWVRLCRRRFVRVVMLLVWSSVARWRAGVRLKPMRKMVYIYRSGLSMAGRTSPRQERTAEFLRP